MLIRFGLLMLRIALEWMVYVEGGRGGRGRGQTWRAAGWLYPSPRKLEIERYGSPTKRKRLLVTNVIQHKGQYNGHRISSKEQ